jgi:hypothetical protein
VKFDAMKKIAKRFIGIWILAAFARYALFAQAAAPARAVGTWVLRVDKSSFGTPLTGLPAGFRITGQTLKIEETRYSFSFIQGHQRIHF